MASHTKVFVEKKAAVNSSVKKEKNGGRSGRRVMDG